MKVVKSMKALKAMKCKKKCMKKALSLIVVLGALLICYQHLMQ